MDALAIAERAGVEAQDHRVGPRPGVFTPIGVMWHYTSTTPGGRNLPTLATVKHGRSDLVGPLSHYLIGRLGTVAVITNGRANHAGPGSTTVLAAVRAEGPLPAPTNNDAAGNRWFVGVELEGTPDSGFTDAQRTSGLALGLALSETLGIGPRAHLGHSEWTNRKRDPGRHWPMGDFRTRLSRRLRQAGAPRTPPEEDLDMDKDELIKVLRSELERDRVLDLNAEFGTLDDPDDGYGERATRQRVNGSIQFLTQTIAAEGERTRAAIEELGASLERLTNAALAAATAAREAAEAATTAAQATSGPEPTADDAAAVEGA
ncbi:MAG: peptidoglycan recognition family protein [Microthrixaceae bacterium]